MAKPVVTSGADQIFTYDASPATVNLTASATESPTGFKWEMLDIPAGSAAATGVNGNFTNGVSLLQNPSFDKDGAIDGTYVLQCRATNEAGGLLDVDPAKDSDPAEDKQSGQTSVLVRTQRLQNYLAGDFQYNWGKTYNDITMRALEAALLAKKHNSVATVAPVGTDDDAAGYEVGSIWLDVTGVQAYICLDATATAAVWTKITTQGAETYEEEFVAAAGANTFTLTTSPRVQANTLSGRDIRGVYRNGARSRYKGTPTLTMEYDQTSGTDKIDVVGQTGGEIFIVVFGV